MQWFHRDKKLERWRRKKEELLKGCPWVKKERWDLTCNWNYWLLVGDGKIIAQNVLYWLSEVGSKVISWEWGWSKRYCGVCYGNSLDSPMISASLVLLFVQFSPFERGWKLWLGSNQQNVSERWKVSTVIKLCCMAKEVRSYSCN